MKQASTQRRRYVVDPKLQYQVSFQILGALLGVAALWLIGMIVLAGPETIAQLEPSEVRNLMFKVNAIYFALGATIVVVLTLLLTHRVAGPAFVIGRALRGMQRGEYDQRLGLRDRDFLKPLAAEVNTLASQLARQEDKRQSVLADLSRCLAEGDLDAAKELVARLRDDATTNADATQASTLATTTVEA